MASVGWPWVVPGREGEHCPLIQGELQGWRWCRHRTLGIRALRANCSLGGESDLLTPLLAPAQGIVFVCFITALWRFCKCNSHTIWFIHFKCTICYIFTDLYNHQCNQFQNIFIYPSRKNLTSLPVTPHFLLPFNPENHESTLFLYKFACSAHFM